MKTFLRNTLPIYLANFMSFFYCFPLAFLALMFAWFPDVPQTTVMLISTMPALFTIFTCLAMSAVLTKVDKKLLMIIGLGLNLISGLAIYLSQGSSLYLVIACATIAGIGYGLIGPTTNAALADVTPADKLPKAIGINTAAGALGLVVLNLVGGFLASDGNWVRAYLTGLIMVPIIIYIIVFCPSMKPSAAAAADGGSAVKVKATSQQIALLAAFVAAFLVYFVGPNGFSLNYSSYVIDVYALGTSVETGIVGTMTSFGSFFGGFVLTGLMTKYLKKYTVVTSMALIAASIASLCICTTNVVLVYIAGFVLGAFAIPIFSTCMTVASKAIPQAGTAISIFTATPGIAMFITPYIIEFVNGFTDGAFINKYYISIAFIIVGAVLVTPLMAKINKNAEANAPAKPVEQPAE